MVIIQSIYLKNFRIHKEKKLDFSDKTIIVGENGSGKSTIFYAILYAILGEKAKEYLPVRSIYSLVRDFSSEAKVILYLKDRKSGDIYEIERFIRKSSTDAILKKNNAIIATGTKIVNKKIQNLLNISNSAKLANVLYIPQGKLGEFIEKSGTKELTSIIERIFDIEYYSSILDVVKKVYRDYLSEKAIYSDLISKREREIEKFKKIYGGKSIEELLQLAKEYEEKYDKYQKLKSKLIELKTLESSIDESLLEQEEELIKVKNSIQKEISELESKLSEIRIRLESLDYRNYSEELLNKDIHDLEKEKETLEKELEKYDRNEVLVEYKELNKILEAINEYLGIKHIEKEYLDLREEIERSISRISELESKKKDIERILELINKGELTKCPVCGRELTKEEYTHIKEKHGSELYNIKLELNKLKQRHYELKKRLYELEREYKRLQGIIRRLEEYSIDISKIDEEKLRIMDKISYLKDILNKFDNLDKITATLNYKLYIQLKDEYSMLSTKLRTYKQEYLKLESLLNKISIMKLSLNKIQSILNNLGFDSIKDLELYVAQLEEELKQYGKINIDTIKLYKAYLDELDELKQKVQKLNKAVSTLLTLKRVIESFLISYRKRLAKNLSNLFSYYVKKLYMYGDIVDAKLEVMESRGEWKYNILVEKNIDGRSFWRDVKDAGLSGGQIKILDLAFRLALAHILKPKLKVLMLDEPTESLDENIRLSLAMLLDSLEDYQIILCTHDELFKNKMNGTIVEFKRESA